MMTRREMLKRGAAAAASFAFLSPLLAAPGGRKFKIGACDWSIGKMAAPTCFEVSKQMGLDGVQVSLGTARDDMKLRQAAVSTRPSASGRRV